MKLDRSLPGVMTSGSGLDAPSPDYLPAKVANVAKEVLRGFPHTKRVGNYLLGKTLGEGSFAKVKEAMHTLTGERVAIKVIDKKKAKADAYVRKNLRREGKLLQVVRHQNVISLLEIMETENSYYLVTELCQGGDLMDLICATKRLEEATARRYTRQIISAIDYLHKAGILHRDLKVENLLLDHNKDIKIIDFGLSNSVRVSHTKEGGSQAQEYCVTQCGSPAYAAPELLGNKKYGPKVDIWSIGVNMYAMLTGNLPFTVEPFNIKALHNKMLNADMNPIPDHLSEDCRDLLKKLLTPCPEERITLRQAMRHPWITDGNNKPMAPAPFPNKLSSDDLDHDIVKHMSANMDYRMSEVIRLATNNIPNNATATYHLLLRKLLRYNESLKSRGGSVDSRVTTPSSSKQAIQRRSTHADVIKLNPINKSQQARDRRESRQLAMSKDTPQRRKPDTATIADHKRPSDTKSTRRGETSPGQAEKTLVRRRIQNARVLASMQDDEVTDDNDDKQEGDDDDERHDEDEDDDGSPSVMRRFTEDFQLESATVTPRNAGNTYALPSIDKTREKRKSGPVKPPSRNSCNNPINNTATHDSSTSTSTSSGEGPKSMCSNPNPTAATKRVLDTTAGAQGSASDPATKTDKKSAAQRRPAAKHVVLDMGQYDKYSKDKSVSNKVLPSVSPPRSFAQSPTRPVNSNRRVVNIVYPTFNSNRSPNRQAFVNRTGRSLSRDSTSNSLNVLGEKATVGGGRGIGIARVSLDSSNKNNKADRLDAAGVEHKITLPSISPPLLRNQGHSTS